MNEFLAEALCRARNEQEHWYEELEYIDAEICKYETLKKEAQNRVDMYSTAVEALTKFVKEA